MMADALSVAAFVVLEKLAERVSFVLHDMFDVPFDEISAIVGRSPAAVRQLASRARRRVQRADAEPERDHADRRTSVAAFLAAARAGDVETLLSVLAPDVVLRADAAAVQMGAPAEVRGPRAVADVFKGRAQVARLAALDGNIGAVWAPSGQSRVAFLFSIGGRRITGIDLIASAERLQHLSIVVIEE